MAPRNSGPRQIPLFHSRKSRRKTRKSQSRDNPVAGWRESSTVRQSRLQQKSHIARDNLPRHNSPVLRRQSRCRRIPSRGRKFPEARGTILSRDWRTSPRGTRKSRGAQESRRSCYKADPVLSLSLARDNHVVRAITSSRKRPATQESRRTTFQRRDNPVVRYSPRRKNPTKNPMVARQNPICARVLRDNPVAEESRDTT